MHDSSLNGAGAARRPYRTGAEAAEAVDEAVADFDRAVALALGVGRSTSVAERLRRLRGERLAEVDVGGELPLMTTKGVAAEQVARVADGAARAEDDGLLT